MAMRNAGPIVKNRADLICRDSTLYARRATQIRRVFEGRPLGAAGRTAWARSSGEEELPRQLPVRVVSARSYRPERYEPVRYN
jgi:hypothetical protein